MTFDKQSNGRRTEVESSLSPPHSTHLSASIKIPVGFPRVHDVTKSTTVGRVVQEVEQVLDGGRQFGINCQNT